TGHKQREPLHKFNYFVSTRILTATQARAKLTQPPQIGALEKPFIALTQSNVGELWSVPAPYTPVPIIADRYRGPSCFIIGYGPNNTTLGVQLPPDSFCVYTNTDPQESDDLRKFNDFLS